MLPSIGPHVLVRCPSRLGSDQSHYMLTKVEADATPSYKIRSQIVPKFPGILEL